MSINDPSLTNSMRTTEPAEKWILSKCGHKINNQKLIALVLLLPSLIASTKKRNFKYWIYFLKLPAEIDRRRNYVTILKLLYKLLRCRNAEINSI